MKLMQKHGSSVELEPLNHSFFFGARIEGLELFDAMQIITWTKWFCHCGYHLVDDVALVYQRDIK
jgi:hypothetical protein